MRGLDVRHFLQDRGVRIAGKPAPTGFAALSKILYTTDSVGAGLPAMAATRSASVIHTVLLDHNRTSNPRRQQHTLRHFIDVNAHRHPLR